MNQNAQTGREGEPGRYEQLPNGEWHFPAAQLRLYGSESTPALPVLPSARPAVICTTQLPSARPSCHPHASR